MAQLHGHQETKKTIGAVFEFDDKTPISELEAAAKVLSGVQSRLHDTIAERYHMKSREHGEAAEKAIRSTMPSQG